MYPTDSPTNDAQDYLRLLDLGPEDELQMCECGCSLFDSKSNMVIDRDNNTWLHKDCVSEYLVTIRPFMLIEDYDNLADKLNKQLK